MRDLAMQISGVLAILVAAVHAVLGERRVFARAQIEPPWARRLVYAVWQCSTVAWLGGGILLFATPLLAPEGARRLTILVLAAVYGAGVIGNAWATRGRHFGWIAMMAVVAFALGGL